MPDANWQSSWLSSLLFFVVEHRVDKSNCQCCYSWFNPQSRAKKINSCLSQWRHGARYSLDGQAGPRLVQKGNAMMIVSQRKTTRRKNDHTDFIRLATGYHVWNVGVFVIPTSVVDVIKLFGGNLDFPKINKLKILFSDAWTCTNMWKHILHKSII